MSNEKFLPSSSEALSVFLSNNNFNAYIVDLVSLIQSNTATSENIKAILLKHNIKHIRDIKEEAVIFCVEYIKDILHDHLITESEKRDIQLIKMCFRIKDGDILKYRERDVEDILRRYFELLYEDNMISHDEALQDIELQGILGLGYDKYDKFKLSEVQRALGEGADITYLNTALNLDRTNIL